MRRSLIANSFALLCVAVCLGISAFAAGTAVGEWSFDRGFRDAEQIFRVERDIPASAMIRRLPITDPDLAGLLKTRFQTIDGFAAGRLSNGRMQALYATPDRERVVGRAFTFEADASILEILGLTAEPGSRWDQDRKDFVFLSQSLATNLYGDPARAIGQFAHLGKESAPLIAGVFEDLPKRSHIRFDVLQPHSDMNLPTIETIDKGALIKAPTGLVSGVIDTMTYLRVPSGLRGDVQSALQNIEARQAPPTFADMRLTGLTEIYFSNVPTRGGQMGDRSLFISLIGGAILFFAMAVSQLRLLVLKGLHSRQRWVYLLKTLGYTPVSIAFGGLLAILGLVGILTSATIIIWLTLTAETRSALGWSAYSMGERPLLSGLALFASVILVILLALNVSELASLFAKPYAVLKARRKLSSFKSLPLKLGVFLNFAIASCLICALVSVQGQIIRSSDIDRGFQAADMFIIEGWRESNAARDALDQTHLIEPIVRRLRSGYGVDSVVLSSTALDVALLPRELFFRENGEPERLQIIYITPGFFDLLDITILESQAVSPSTGDLSGIAEGDQPEESVRANGLRLFPAFISQSMASYLGRDDDDRMMGGTLSHMSGARFEISAVVGDIITGDPELSDPRVIYIIDEKRAANILVKALATDQAEMTSDLSHLDLAPGLVARRLQRRVNASLEAKSQRRDFIVIMAIAVALAALLASLNLFVMMLQDARKTIVIRQVYGFTFWPLVGLWFPRMIWPIAAGSALGAVSIFFLPQTRDVAMLIRGISPEHQIITVAGLVLIAAVLIVTSILSLCRIIDLQALRNDGLAT